MPEHESSISEEDEEEIIVEDDQGNTLTYEMLRDAIDDVDGSVEANPEHIRNPTAREEEGDEDEQFVSVEAIRYAIAEEDFVERTGLLNDENAIELEIDWNHEFFDDIDNGDSFSINITYSNRHGSETREMEWTRRDGQGPLRVFRSGFDNWNGYDDLVESRDTDNLEPELADVEEEPAPREADHNDDMVAEVSAEAEDVEMTSESNRMTEDRHRYDLTRERNDRELREMAADIETRVDALLRKRERIKNILEDEVE